MTKYVSGSTTTNIQRDGFKISVAFLFSVFLDEICENSYRADQINNKKFGIKNSLIEIIYK